MYLEHADKAHYVFIKDFEELMFGQHSKHGNKKHFCSTCLHCFAKRQTLEEHKQNGCYAQNGERFEILEEGHTFKFKSNYNK
jgi:hypothetical protein